MSVITPRISDQQYLARYKTIIDLGINNYSNLIIYNSFVGYLWSATSYSDYTEVTYMCPLEFIYSSKRTNQPQYVFNEEFYPVASVGEQVTLEKCYRLTFNVLKSSSSETYNYYEY